MNIWQVDFDHLPLLEPEQQRRWELIICDTAGKLVHTAQCFSEQANSQWLEQQLREAAKDHFPDKIAIFRPQALSLLTIAAAKLKIPVEATRYTPALKKELNHRYTETFPNYNPLDLEKPPPQALPENIWGKEWQIANIVAGEIVDLFCDRPLPILNLPEAFLPINLGIASDVSIPGIVVYGGKKSMIIARWIEDKVPAFINYIPTQVGKSGGFILETGLVDRWIFNTFESELVAQSAINYEQKKQAAIGLHFLLIQPDDSGMTSTAFWLLKQD
jgi:RNA-binding protein Tab2/Atab2